MFCTRQAEANVVVAIVRRIVVAIRRSAILRSVVPTAAAIHAVRARFVRQPNGNEGNKSDCCNLRVLAWRICAIVLCTEAANFSTSILPQ